MPSAHLVIIGVAKSGITALARWLGERPGMVLGTPKEPRFFSILAEREGAGPGVTAFARSTITSEAWYRATFAHKPGADWAIVASTDYIWCEASLERIASKARRHRTRVICVTRDPVARTISQDRHTLRMGLEETLTEALEREGPRRRSGWQPVFWHIARSRISHRIDAYGAAFGDNLLVLDHPPCQGYFRQISEVDDGLRRAEDRTDGGVLERAEGIGDREDASTPQHASPAVVAGGGYIDRHAVAVAV